MKIKLVFDAQFCGSIEDVVEVSDKITEDEIKALFPKYLGLDFDENCFWELVNDMK